MCVLPDHQRPLVNIDAGSLEYGKVDCLAQAVKPVTWSCDKNFRISSSWCRGGQLLEGASVRMVYTYVRISMRH